MTECLCGHGEWCRHCTSIPLPPKKEENLNYKYKDFEECWFNLNLCLNDYSIKEVMEIGFNAARETK